VAVAALLLDADEVVDARQHEQLLAVRRERLQDLGKREAGAGPARRPAVHQHALTVHHDDEALRRCRLRARAAREQIQVRQAERDSTCAAQERSARHRRTLHSSTSTRRKRNASVRVTATNSSRSE
jgi:hypothetical protein